MAPSTQATIAKASRWLGIPGAIVAVVVAINAFTGYVGDAGWWLVKDAAAKDVVQSEPHAEVHQKLDSLLGGMTCLMGDGTPSFGQCTWGDLTIPLSDTQRLLVEAAKRKRKP